MNIYTVRLITFSPTHTSKQVGEAIVRGSWLLLQWLVRQVSCKRVLLF